MEMFVSWQGIKNLASVLNETIQYSEDNFRYIICVPHDGIQNYTELFKNTDLVAGLNVEQNDTNLEDFETNYKSDAIQL